LQDLAGFAQDKVACTRLGRTGNPFQAVGAFRASLPAAVAQRRSRLNYHTNAVAAVASTPFSVLVDQQHWPTSTSIRVLVAHSVSSDGFP
jgi:hypothetical protein